ncbi:hypothetical protein M408DRAFT_59186, partial [Serendipita vermifera MAFF 305830]
GDITNLVGCILTHQLPFQTYLASYFVFVDMSLVAQYIYYYKPPPPSSPDYSPLSSRPPSSLAMTMTPTAVVYSPRNLTRPSSRTPLLHRRPHDSPPLTPEQKRRLLGRISAWACTTLYLTSRLPQIWKNYTRKSVQGLSLALFVFAFLGNTFYVASILSSPTIWEESLPYLLGSGGTLCFDIIIVSQGHYFRIREKG